MARKRTKKELNDLRQKARELVITQGKTQKEAAEIVGVTEATISDWANNGLEGSWNDLRKARQSSTTTARENIQRIIALFSQKRLDIETQINDAIVERDPEKELELRKQAKSISDEMSMQNKALVEINKEYRAAINLGVYIDVQDEIFAALREYNPDLWDKTIDFQMIHARKKANELS